MLRLRSSETFLPRPPAVAEPAVPLSGRAPEIARRDAGSPLSSHFNPCGPPYLIGHTPGDFPERFAFAHPFLQDTFQNLGNACRSRARSTAEPFAVLPCTPRRADGAVKGVRDKRHRCPVSRWPGSTPACRCRSPQPLLLPPLPPAGRWQQTTEGFIEPPTAGSLLLP